MSDFVIDYYFSVVSPYTYMAQARFLNLLVKYENVAPKVNYKPADILKVFSETGGLPLGKRSPARQAYRMTELKRWKEALNLDLNFEPKHFPVPDGDAQKVVVAAIQAGHDPGKVALGFMRACWAEERDVSDAETIKAVVQDAGLNPDELIPASQTATAQAQYDQNTAEAIERGVFGAPSWILEGELFWGQDRLHFLERALMKASGHVPDI